jgi:uncharacterized protein (DUF1330 family)
MQNLALFGELARLRSSTTITLQSKKVREMKNTLKSAAFALCGYALAASAAAADPVYVMAQIQIEDHQRYFDEYGTAVFPLVMGTGAKVLVATPTVQVLEGEWDGNWTVVIEFPSAEAADEDWYNTDAYREVRELRFATTSVNNLVIAPAFVPPTQ